LSIRERLAQARAKLQQKSLEMAPHTTNLEESGGTDTNNKILSSLTTFTGGLNTMKYSKFATAIRTKFPLKEDLGNSAQSGSSLPLMKKSKIGIEENGIANNK
jgi:hypothetical protein